MKVFLPLLLWVANAIAVAQGPVAPNLAPQTYKLLFENERVRVIEEHLKPGEKEPMHSHLYGVFACFLTDAHIRTTFPDGDTSEDFKKAGDTVWRDPVTHAGENIGKAEIHELMIEPKTASQSSGPTAVSSSSPPPQVAPSQPMPASREPHHHVRYENQYIRILEVLLEPEESSLFHTHSNDILYVTLADASARGQDQGEDWGPEIAFKAGAVSFEKASKTPHTHRLKNVGHTMFHTINVELLP
jgi:beta-alanine degradation protein BauB